MRTRTRTVFSFADHFQPCDTPVSCVLARYGTHPKWFRALPLVADGIMYRVGKGVRTTGSVAEFLAVSLPEALQPELPDMGIGFPVGMACVRRKGLQSGIL